MKKWASLENSTLNKIDNVVIELPTPERLLENVIKMFLQFDSEYWLMYASIRNNSRTRYLYRCKEK
jgi:hypothetical protein